jgi:hypothetical protein
MPTDQIISILQHLAWPVVALIALLALRPYLRELIQAASNLNSLLNKSDELAKLVSSVETLGNNIVQVPPLLAEVKAAQEVLIANRELGATASKPEPTTKAERDAIWAQIEQSWYELRDAIRDFARPNGVEPYLMGRVGVANTMDALVSKGATKEGRYNKQDQGPLGQMAVDVPHHHASRGLA